MKLKEIINLRRVRDFESEINENKKDICDECPFHCDNLCNCDSYNKSMEFPCIMDKLIDFVNDRAEKFNNSDFYDEIYQKLEVTQNDY